MMKESERQATEHNQVEVCYFACLFFLKKKKKGRRDEAVKQ